MYKSAPERKKHCRVGAIANTITRTIHNCRSMRSAIHHWSTTALSNNSLLVIVVFLQ